MKHECTNQNYNYTPKHALVVLNEQHTLLKEQEEILYNWELLSVPAEGWTLEQMPFEVIFDHMEKEGVVVFASPIPALLIYAAKKAGMTITAGEQTESLVFVFHNDKREKKELPNGKIISVTAKEGWVLV